MVPIRAIEPELDRGLAEGGRNRRRFRVLPNRKRSVAAMELRAARVIRLAALEVWQTLPVAPAIGAERVPQIEIRWRKLGHAQATVVVIKLVVIALDTERAKND